MIGRVHIATALVLGALVLRAPLEARPLTHVLVQLPMQALAGALWEAGKFVSLPLLVGLPLRLGWARAHPLLRGVLKAQALSMLGGCWRFFIPMRRSGSAMPIWPGSSAPRAWLSRAGAGAGGGMGGPADLCTEHPAHGPAITGRHRMTIAESVAHFARYAAGKDAALRADPLGFALSAMKAGAYVGIGIILIFTLGQTAEPEWRYLVMGASFGITLKLVIFAGSDLFTGHAMYGAHAWLSGSLRAGAVQRLWAASWGSNLAGSVILAALFVIGGGGVVLQAEGVDRLHQTALNPVNLCEIGEIAASPS